MALGALKVKVGSINYLVTRGPKGEPGLDGAIPGEVKMWAGSTLPAGYLFCDGASVSRSTYPGLFSAIGTQFGSVDITSFNVPDLRDREPRGSLAMGGALGNDGLALGARAAGHTHVHSHTTTSVVSGGVSSAGTGTSLSGGIAGANTDHNHAGPAAHPEANTTPTSGGAARVTSGGHGSTATAAQAGGISHGHGHTFGVSDPGHAHGHTITVASTTSDSTAFGHPQQTLHFIVKT